MRISGFTFVRNAVKLYYPVVESIRSILPICDELVVAAGDSDDGTTELIRSIGDPKIKIIETVWDRSQFVRGASNAQQTNIALDACSGDWCFYVQADEVVHENDLEPLVQRMQTYLHDPRVEGLLFEYLHFFADYGHYQFNHSWYRREVRIVRNHLGIRSWKSAQGFRRDRRKIHVVPAAARIFHYGWVRPPRQMTRKQHAFLSLHAGPEAADQLVSDRDKEFEFGMLCQQRRFTGSHPRVMFERIAAKDWGIAPGPLSHHDHDKPVMRALSWLENTVLGFRVGEHRNYRLLPP
jgi:glycosyltransferase involved in cell wall biosynthesis